MSEKPQSALPLTSHDPYADTIVPQAPPEDLYEQLARHPEALLYRPYLPPTEHWHAHYPIRRRELRVAIWVAVSDYIRFEIDRIRSLCR